MNKTLEQAKATAIEAGKDPLAITYGAATYDLCVADVELETKAVFISCLSFMMAAVQNLDTKTLDALLQAADETRTKVLETLAKEGFVTEKSATAATN